MKYWFGTVKVQGYRIKFHDAPGWSLEEHVPGIGWVNADDVPLRVIPEQLREAIRVFRPGYPIYEVLQEEKGGL